jgi:hypothetical protein
MWQLFRAEGTPLFKEHAAGEAVDGFKITESWTL